MDVLLELTQGDILQLHNFYAKFQDSAPQIWNFLHSVLKWVETNSNLIKIYALNGQWFPDGTFIAILKFNCYEIYMHTMEKSCKRLVFALKHTKVIKWDIDTVIYALHSDLQPHVIKTLRELEIPICFVQDNSLWLNSADDGVLNIKSESLRLGADFYLGPLNESHANVINEIWPYRYEGSEEYVRTIIEQNGGMGIFRSNTAKQDELVAWVLKNGVGMLGLLQTKNEYKKMGLASWAVKAMCKKMLSENYIPMCTIALSNEASQKTFIKSGFKLFAKCCYIGIGTESSIAFDSEYDCGLTQLNC